MIDEVVPGWTRYPLVGELQALRGVSRLHAAILVAKAGRSSASIRRDN